MWMVAERGLPIYRTHGSQRLICTERYSFPCPRHKGWDSLVGVVTRYGLDNPGIESRPNLVLVHPPVQWVPGRSRGKAAGAWR
jgi:hypothetical protein